MHRFLVVGVAALAALALGAPPAGAWSWPADGVVLRPFGMGSDPYAGGQHRGVDVAGPEGAPIRAPAAGTVTFAGSLPTHGRGVTIQTADGYAVTLVHLGSIGVEKGVSVTEGAPIGTMGWSGTAEHAVPSVHLGIRRGSDADAYVDPLGLLPPRAVSAPPPSPAPAPVPAPTPAPAPVAPPTPPVASPQPPSDAPGPSASPAPAASPTSTPASPGQPTGGTATPAPGSLPTAGSTAATPPDPALGSSAIAGQGSPQGQPGLTISEGGRSAQPVADRPGAGRPSHAVRLRAAGSGDAGTPAARSGPVPAVAASAAAAGPRDVRSAPGRAMPAGADFPARTASEPGKASPARPGAVAATADAGSDAVAPHRASRGAPIPTRGAGRAIREGGAPLGPILAAFLLGCLVAAAGIRRSARRIDGNGAVLPDDADLLRELDPAHRARVHDRRRGHLRPPPAAARS